MPKSLKDIIGTRAGRDVPKGEEDFLDQHKVAEKDYPVKQKVSNIPFKADNIKKDDSLRHGHIAPGASESKYKNANEETLPEKTCNNTMEGTSCPVHGLKECMAEDKKNVIKEKGMKKEGVEKIDELTGKGKLGDIYRQHTKDRNQAARDRDFEKAKSSDRKATRAIGMMSHNAAVSAVKSILKTPKTIKTVYKGPKYKATTEDVEQIDELSTDVLKSYKTKQLDTKDKSPRQSYNRLVGSARATRKIDAKEKTNEDVDYEGEMAKTQLKALANKAATLSMMMKDDQQLEAWVQSKISNAKQMVDAIHDYLVYRDPPEMNKETTGPDSPMTFPHMNVDNNYGAV
jgi:hypothetical protein